MKLSPANMEHLSSYKKFLFECYQGGLTKYESALNKPEEFLESVVSSQNETTTFFCIANEEIVGAIRFRHFTNEYIENVIGHVGYETKPSARGKGIAKLMLSWVQRNIMRSSAIITCEVDNIASEKVITSCGGDFINQIYSTEKQNHVKRYALPNV